MPGRSVGVRSACQTRQHPSYSHLVGRGCVPMAQARGKGSRTTKAFLAIGAGSDKYRGCWRLSGLPLCGVLALIVATTGQSMRSQLSHAVVAETVAPMPKAHTRCYSSEIKNPEGVRLFSTKAYWTEKERRVALGQIMRLSGMPEASFYAEPALESQSEKTTPRRSSTERHPG